MLKQLICVGCIALASGINAQENSVSSGGDASGTGGSVSYSIGQIDYVSGSNGASYNEGVQQPYEFFVTVGLEELNDLSIELFPNPVTDELTIKTKEYDGLRFQLVDNSGRIVLFDQLTSEEHQLNVSQLAAGEYHLRINSSTNNIGTYQLIKH